MVQVQKCPEDLCPEAICVATESLRSVVVLML